MRRETDFQTLNSENAKTFYFQNPLKGRQNFMRIKLAIILLGLLTVDAFGQKSEYKGTFVVSGTGSFDDSLSLKSFVNLLKNRANSNILFIPTASSGIRLPNGYVFIPPKGDTTKAYIESFEAELTKLFGVQRVTLLHTRARSIANSDSFINLIKKSDGVWISSGNAGRLADSYLRTNTHKEIKRLIERGGVVGGNSAGAIIMGSYIVRGWTEKPMLMAKGHDKGFGLIDDVAINPHLLTAKREYELISVIHQF